MRKINLKGITSEAVINVALLALALTNAVLQMFAQLYRVYLWLLPHFTTLGRIVTLVQLHR